MEDTVKFQTPPTSLPPFPKTHNVKCDGSNSKGSVSLASKYFRLPLMLPSLAPPLPSPPPLPPSPSPPSPPTPLLPINKHTVVVSTVHKVNRMEWNQFWQPFFKRDDNMNGTSVCNVLAMSANRVPSACASPLALNPSFPFDLYSRNSSLVIVCDH